jgi:hypothetical protein
MIVAAAHEQLMLHSLIDPHTTKGAPITNAGLECQKG